MSNIEYDPELAKLKGSEQHHDLKNKAGEKADEDHAKSDATPSDTVVDAVSGSDDETQIADKLREVAGNDK